MLSCGCDGDINNDNNTFNMFISHGRHEFFLIILIIIMRARLSESVDLCFMLTST